MARPRGRSNHAWRRCKCFHMSPHNKIGSMRTCLSGAGTLPRCRAASQFWAPCGQRCSSLAGTRCTCSARRRCTPSPQGGLSCVGGQLQLAHFGSAAPSNSQNFWQKTSSNRWNARGLGSRMALSQWERCMRCRRCGAHCEPCALHSLAAFRLSLLLRTGGPVSAAALTRAVHLHQTK